MDERMAKLAGIIDGFKDEHAELVEKFKLEC